MLIDFRIRNFKSIGDDVWLDMRASSDAELRGNVVDSPELTGRRGLGLLRSALMYGANASGKSNICEALFRMRQFVVDSATELNEGDAIPGIEPFRLSTKFEAGPTLFELRVALEGYVFRYGFEATRERINGEWLYQTRNAPRSREVRLFWRVGSDKSAWVFDSALKGRKELLRERTRAVNGLILSKAAQESFDQLAVLYRWFRDMVEVDNMANRPWRLYDLLAARCHVGHLPPDRLAEIARVADGAVESADTALHDVPGPDDARSRRGAVIVVEEAGHEVTRNVAELRFARKKADSGELVPFDFSLESSGTRRFLALAQVLLDAFRSGKTVVVDEMECSLHPHLAQLVVEIANDPQLGMKGAQFIIATHDTNLMDFDRLRRDQLIMVQKGPDHQTEVYSLYDLDPKPKLDSAAEKRYLASRFGGVPILGNLRLAIADALACEEVGEKPRVPT